MREPAGPEVRSALRSRNPSPPRSSGWRWRVFLYYRYHKEKLLRLLKVVIPSCCLILAACAANKTSATHPDDYVEVDNPFMTMSKDAPATIWVPRSSVEGSAVPRAGELVKKGTEKVVQSIKQSPPQTPAQTPVAAPQPQQQTVVASAAQPPVVKTQPAAEVSRCPVKSRVALLEVGQGGLVRPLYENLQRAGIGLLIDPAQAAFLAQYSTIADQKGKGSFAKRLQQEYGANAAVFVTAPDGVAPGKAVSAEVYDAMGGGLLRRFDTVIPAYADKDPAARDAAVAAALATFTERIRETVALLPWYGRIIEVDGNRVYIAAGKEAGLQLGQVLTIYRSGKFIEGLGFAPGDKIGTLVVSGFVGPNGSFATIREGQGVHANDLVAVE